MSLKRRNKLKRELGRDEVTYHTFY